MGWRTDMVDEGLREPAEAVLGMYREDAIEVIAFLLNQTNCQIPRAVELQPLPHDSGQFNILNRKYGDVVAKGVRPEVARMIKKIVKGA